jgi:demethoxyubiquinone hydroxylase (CLK1/Coq7/Cat5 family)
LINWGKVKISNANNWNKCWNKSASYPSAMWPLWLAWSFCVGRVDNLILPCVSSRVRVTRRHSVITKHLGTRQETSNA